MRYSLELLRVGAIATLLLLGCKSSGGGSNESGDLCRAVDCGDDNDCTVDACNPDNGRCIHEALDDGAFCGEGYCEAGECEPIASTFPCSEQGIRSAIAAGGGPHGFDCGGGNLITTDEEIVIDNDVILDGRSLTVSGGLSHRVFSVTSGVTAQVWRFTVTNGAWSAFELGGGGIYNDGTLTLRNCTVSHSEALQKCSGSCFDGAGGGILNDGTMTIENSTISNNRATGGNVNGEGGGVGGGVSNEGTLTVLNSMIFQNSGQLWAAGIANGRGPTLLGATLTVINSTFSGNVCTNAGASPGVGAGIGNEGTATIVSTTFSENNAAVGGAVASRRGTVTIANSILDDECDGDISSDGYNVESPGDTCNLNRGTDLANVTNADLGIERPLDYGGPTWTHALEPDSIAVDLIPMEACVDADGEPLDTDQRGSPRPRGLACDVGSFEVFE